MLGKLFINNAEKTVKEITLRAIAAIMTTANPGAKTVVDAIHKAGGAAYVELFAANGDSSDIFRVQTVGTRGKKTVTTTGEGTREIIVNRMRLALDAASWQTSIVVESDGETESADSDGETVEVL